MILPAMNPSDLATIVILLGFAVALVIWIVVAHRRSAYSYSWSHATLYFISFLFTRVLWRTEIKGRILLPADQGAIIISNHRSSVDPWFLQLGMGRHVRWMVAKEFFKTAAAGWFLNLTECIPTARNGVDTAAIREVMRCVDEGGLVGMFPEGRINTGKEFLMPCRPGAIMIALKCGAPVVPCYIGGSPYDGTMAGAMVMPAKAVVRIGKPIDLSQYHNGDRSGALLGKLMLHVMKEIATLGGKPDYQPQLAGKRWKPGEEAA